MNVIAECDGKIYAGVVIHAPGDLASPFKGVLFPCLIWDHGSAFAEQQRTDIARVLLDAGCRYAVCGGNNCRLWETALDVEFVTRYRDAPDDIREAVHVMTTSHYGESPDDVAFFFVHNTNFDHHDFKHFLIVHMGTGESVTLVEDAVRLQALDGEAV